MIDRQVTPRRSRRSTMPSMVDQVQMPSSRQRRHERQKVDAATTHAMPHDQWRTIRGAGSDMQRNRAVGEIEFSEHL
jgi:hypothetical protein